MMTTEPRKVTQPLGSVAVIFSALLVAFLALLTVETVRGSGAILGFGHTFICVDAPGTYSQSNWSASSFGFTAVHGASIQVNGTIQACTTFHPSTTQRVLDTLTSLPSWLMWGSVLFLLVRMIGVASREGPFTPRTAAIMRRLGWLIIAGTAITVLIQALAQHELLNTMLTQPGTFTTFLYVSLLTLPFDPMLLVAALAGAALLTFARITRLGAAMDDEIRGTV
jgi:Protein of unknown function (DUF2975)